MKKIIICLIFICNLVFAQNLPLLEKLDSPMFGDRFEALNTIKNETLFEYIPELEIRIFLQESFWLQYCYLETLDALNADNCYSLLTIFYNNLDIVTFDIKYDTYTILEYKVLANSLFFKYSDFSKVDLLFEYLNQNDKIHYPIVLNDLKTVYNNLPANRNQVKQELLEIFNNTEIEYYLRKTAIEILSETDYEDISTLCVNTINLTNENPDLKLPCLKILNHISYSGLRDFLVQNIPLQNSAFIRFQMCTNLLYKFGFPADLFLVKNHFPTEPDEDDRVLLQYIVEDFIPPRPTVTTDKMIENLITYNDELFDYGWISIESLHNDFEASIKEIGNEYRNSDLRSLCEVIYNLLNQIDDAVAADNLTNEGYKFMHYHVMYIKESIETELGTCEEREK